MGATYTRQSSSTIVDGATIEAAHFNAEFDQLVTAFAADTGHTHDGTSAEGGDVTKLLGTAITIGDGTAGTDIAVTFDGESNDGVLTWMEDEDYFKFSDDILINSTEKLMFQDTGTYIYSNADGDLDLVSDGTNADAINLASAGGVTVDAAVDIVLDAGGGDIFFKDDGTTFGSATNTSGNLIIKSGTTTALTFSGANATLAGDLTISGDDLTMGTNTDTAVLVADGKTGNKIIDFLNSEKMSGPWIYFLHIFDLHAIREGSIAGGLKDYSSDKFGNTKYERIVSSIDVWVGKIIKKINFNKTLIVLTADHGERIPKDDMDVVSFEPEFKKSVKFGKKILPKSSQKIGGKFLSKVRKSVASVKVAKANQNLISYHIRSRLPHFTLSLYDENIRIPLLFCGYNIKSKIINQQVSSADIFLTLTDILQHPLETKLDGTSLFPLLNGRKIPENPIYLHTMPHEDLTDGDAVGVRTSHFKYFRHARNSGKNIHLFDLKNDPFENENIFYDFPDVVKKMEEIISNYPDNTKKITSPKFSAEEQKIAKELKKLGYM